MFLCSNFAKRGISKVQDTCNLQGQLVHDPQACCRLLLERTYCDPKINGNKRSNGKLQDTQLKDGVGDPDDVTNDRT